METREKVFNVLTLGPIIAAPFLAVEFPRILAYLPIMSAIFGGLFLYFGLHIKPQIPKPVLVFFGGLLAFSALSLFWAQFYEDSLDRFIKIAVLLPFYALFLGVLKSGRPYFTKNMIFYLLIASSAGALLMAVDLAFESGIHKFLHGVGASEPFSTAVFNRGAISIIFLGGAGFLLLERKLSLINALLFIPFIAMFLMIQSQSAQLAVLIGLLFYYIFPASKAWAWSGLFAVIAIFMLVKPLIVEPIRLLIPQSVDDYEIIRQTFIWHRFQIWEFVSEYALKSPFWGHGLEVTKNLWNENVYQNGTHTTLHPHSVVLQIWIEFGLIGIALAIFAIGILLKYMYSALEPSIRRAALTSFILAFAVAEITYGIWQSWWLGLLVMLVAVFVAQVPKKAVV